jgi:predicted lipoprotein with Yx(FWY)xxD motif
MKNLKINYCLFLIALLFAYPLGASAQDPDPSSDIGSLTPEQQQAIWLTEAYRFLNGDSYPYTSVFYSSPYMPYSARPYYPYYSPYYTPYTSYNAPYTTPTQPYLVPAQGYAAPVQMTTPTQAYTSPATAYTIMTASNLSTGTYLTDGRGMTLYHLQSDQGSYTSKCTDATCTGIWPPFYSGSISVPGNLNPADFRTITVNGYKQYQQTTFKGWPLYYFYKDMKPGDVYGQGLRDSYGVWSVVSPESLNTFPANFPYSSGGVASAQYQYPMQQPSTITLTPTPPTYTVSSPYPALPTPRPVTTPISGNVPVTIRYPGNRPFDVYIDGNYVGTSSGGSFSFNANSGIHSIRVWDGNFDYVKSVSLESGVPKIIYVQAV